MYQRDRETEGDKDRLSHWPIFSSSSLEHITLCYLQGLTSLLLLLPGQGPLWVVVPLGTRWPVSVTDRVETQDPRLKIGFSKTPHICCGPCIYNFTTPTFPVVTHVICFHLFTQVHPAITLFAQTEHTATCVIASSMHKSMRSWVPYVCPLSFRRGICCLLYNYSAGVSRWFLHFPPPHPARWGSFPENYTFVAPCNTFTRWHLYSTTSRNHLILLS